MRALQVTLQVKRAAHPKEDNRKPQKAQARDEKISGLLSGESRLSPGAPAAVHRDAVRVTHFLQVIGSQRRAETASTVEDERCRFIGDRLLDVALDDALSQMNSAGQMAARPFVIFADVHEREFFPGIEAPLDLAEVQLLHAGFRVIDDGKESLSVFHKYSPWLAPSHKGTE